MLNVLIGLFLRLKPGMRTFVSILIWAKGRGFEGINRQQKDAVQQLFESNGWPWNVEVTSVCETESTALTMSVDKPRPFVVKFPRFKAFES